MATPLRALLVGAVLCFGTAAFAFAPEDPPGAADTGDAGVDGMVTETVDMAMASEDASAEVHDMAKRPGAAKATLPGCSMVGSPVAPLGSALVVGALILFALRPRAAAGLARVRARRTARRRP